MKIRKLLHILLIPSLLCGCSNEVPAEKSENNDNNLPNSTNKNDDSQLTNDDQPKDNGNQNTDPPEETTEGPLTITGGEELGGFLTAIRFPHYASIDSSVQFEVFIGHAWDGTLDFSSKDENYLQWKYYLEMHYVKGKASKNFPDGLQWTKTQLMELDYNTDKYDVTIRYYVRLYASEVVIIDKELFELADGECGSIYFEIKTVNAQGQEVAATIGPGCIYLPVYFKLESDTIRFEKSLVADFYS